MAISHITIITQTCRKILENPESTESERLKAANTLLKLINVKDRRDSARKGRKKRQVSSNQPQNALDAILEEVSVR